MTYIVSHEGTSSQCTDFSQETWSLAPGKGVICAQGWSGAAGLTGFHSGCPPSHRPFCPPAVLRIPVSLCLSGEGRQYEGTTIRNKSLGKSSSNNPSENRSPRCGSDLGERSLNLQALPSNSSSGVVRQNEAAGDHIVLTVTILPVSLPPFLTPLSSWSISVLLSYPRTCFLTWLVLPCKLVLHWH